MRIRHPHVVQGHVPGVGDQIAVADLPPTAPNSAGDADFARSIAGPWFAVTVAASCAETAGPDGGNPVAVRVFTMLTAGPVHEGARQVTARCPGCVPGAALTESARSDDPVFCLVRQGFLTG
jgi:hypothetical protein